MKIIIIALSMYSLMCNAQEKQQDKFIKIAKEVVDFFAPIYLRGEISASMSDILVFDDNWDKSKKVLKLVNNKKYIKVTLKQTGTDMVSEVAILVDSYTPVYVLFSKHIGRNFYYVSFDEWKIRGINTSERITTVD